MKAADSLEKQLACFPSQAFILRADLVEYRQLHNPLVLSPKIVIPLFLLKLAYQGFPDEVLEKSPWFTGEQIELPKPDLVSVSYASNLLGVPVEHIAFLIKKGLLTPYLEGHEATCVVEFMEPGASIGPLMLEFKEPRISVGVKSTTVLTQFAKPFSVTQRIAETHSTTPLSAIQLRLAQIEKFKLASTTNTVAKVKQTKIKTRPKQLDRTGEYGCLTTFFNAAVKDYQKQEEQPNMVPEWSAFYKFIRDLQDTEKKPDYYNGITVIKVTTDKEICITTPDATKDQYKKADCRNRYNAVARRLREHPQSPPT